VHAGQRRRHRQSGAGAHDDHRAATLERAQPLPQLPGRQRRLQIHQHQRRPAVRPHRQIHLVQGADKARLQAAQGADPPHQHRQFQRFIQYENVHGVSAPVC
jgi:hypothetical protein